MNEKILARSIEGWKINRWCSLPLCGVDCVLGWIYNRISVCLCEGVACSLLFGWVLCGFAPFFSFFPTAGEFFAPRPPFQLLCRWWVVVVRTNFYGLQRTVDRRVERISNGIVFLQNTMQLFQTNYDLPCCWPLNEVLVIPKDTLLHISSRSFNGMCSPVLTLLALSTTCWRKWAIFWFIPQQQKSSF